MIDLRVVGGTEIQARMETGLYPAAIAGAMAAMARIDVELQSFIVTQKLSGQVLNRITGKLQESIKTFPVVEAGGTVTGGVYQDEEIAPYGKFHELGAEVPERIGNPLRFVTKEGNVVFATRASAFRLPVRSFMFSSAQEFHSAYDAAMRDEVIGRLQEAWAR